MALWQNGAFVNDPWRHVAEGEDVSPAGHVIIPLDWWNAVRDIFAQSNAPVGVLLQPSENLESIAKDISRLSLIALAFPSYTDGRSFSKAQLLRERHQFSGELRATGDILTDQLYMLDRCGFDALEITDPHTIKALQERSAWKQTLFYQPSVLDELPAGQRPWLRHPAR